MSVKTMKLRQEYLLMRDGLDPGQRKRSSRVIQERVLALAELRNIELLFVYVHFRSEVETGKLIRAWLEQGRRITVPLTLERERCLDAIEIRDPERELEPGYCGIPEPRTELTMKNEVEPALIQAAVIPGSVFDRRGGRLGYGGGYYDRFLAHRAPRALRIGVAYAGQVVDRLDLQPHDQILDILVTEEEVLRFDRKSHENSRLSTRSLFGP